nr:tetratricopeptide repeat protein [Pedobacter panaciterrae]
MIKAQNSRSVYDAYYFLGKIYFELKDFKKAEEIFQKVRDRGINVEEKYNKKI